MKSGIAVMVLGIIILAAGGIKFVRLAITMEQVKRLRPISHQLSV